MFWTFQVLAVVSAALADTSTEESSAKSIQFRSDYDYYPEVDGWFKLHRIPATWREARLRCQFEGGVLASPVNPPLAYTMRRVLRVKHLAEESVAIFTGVHSTFSTGDFYSINGVPLSHMPVSWAPGEPNNYNNNEKCIAFTESGTIADVDCRRVLPYLCYKKRTKGMGVNKCGTTDPLYTFYEGTGSCYKFHREARTWSRAFMVCAAEGGHLAIPNSDEEAKLMKTIFDKHPIASILQVGTAIMRYIMHIGFSDWGERSDWRTIHGESLQEAGYNKFAAGQPDNSTGGEFCGSMFRTGLLNDVWCHEIGPFLCEKSPQALTDYSK